MKLTIRTKTIGMNKNIILSIIDGAGNVINTHSHMDSNMVIKEGGMYTDEEMYSFLKTIDSRHNCQRPDNKINQWIV